jgi:hypothetical protein
MNAQYFIEFSRGDQLLRSIPELSGASFVETGFRKAADEDVRITKAAIGGRVGQGSVAHQAWVKELASRLKQRRGEFLQYKKAIQPGIDSVHGLERLERFATELQCPARSGSVTHR